MDTEVLVVGGGPVGLTAAVELRRRAVEVMVIDRLLAPAPYAKAVGVQPRTVELWDAAGLARRALDAAVTMRGQLTFVDGAQTSRLELQLPDDVPYHFVALPQYETERVLAEALAGHGTRVGRGVELVRFTQDADMVTSTVHDDGGQRTVTSRYLIGADGAHSVVRKGLGLTFDGDAFAEEYMLADVEVDWDMPTGYGIRASHQTDGVTDDVLVCIPLPGTKRYRISMLVPDELSTKGTAADGIAHGLEGGAAPQLHHIQAVLDRLSPEPVTASNLRWSSVFRISHRLVDRYGVGRVFVAGDAAHIHPPTGAQGMNTGVQDAYNLGWKLALAVHGSAADGLLESYQAERHPVGEEVVGRTVRAARSGIGAGESDLATVIAREAQLLVGYPDSPLSYQHDSENGLSMGPVAGQRAPDASGLTQDSVGYPMRVHELLRHTGHTLLLWAGDASAVTAQLQLASVLTNQLDPHLRCYLIAAPGVEGLDASGCVFRDTADRFAISYGIGDVAAGVYLVRPDGYLAFRSSRPAVDVLLDHLRRTLRW
ncbi:MAG: FAD-dependent monooxygenase [Actinomycetota bacterium]|nr:FAD-dependent monooxygenase [Actinomycetota bacterium]